MNMKKATILTALIFIMSLFIISNIFGESPKISIEQRIVVYISTLIDRTMVEELDNLENEIKNINKKLSKDEILELKQNFGYFVDSGLNDIKIYKDIVTNNSYSKDNITMLNKTEGFIKDIGEKLDKIYSLDISKNKKLAEDIFRDIYKDKEELKKYKSEFAKENNCIE